MPTYLPPGHQVFQIGNRLEEIQSLWAVTYINRDDGHRMTAAVFTDRNQADVYSRATRFGNHQSISQVSLWKDAVSGKFYEISKREVFVDLPLHRKRALEKLTEEERSALGVSHLKEQSNG